MANVFSHSFSYLIKGHKYLQLSQLIFLFLPFNPDSFLPPMF